ncbi:protein ALP1-like [Malus domestica]|uniref:protein ALP1-like n=1 Tax=Malus domestica TaxID=3750 RepID=UPI003974B35C
MENTHIVDMLMRLKRKRAINEEENRKKRKIIVSTIIYVIVMVMHWYSTSVLLKEPSNDWDQERQSFLGRLFDGKDSTCIEQLRVSKSAFKQLCEILQGIGGLVRTRNVSIEESVAIFFNILAHNLKFRVIGFHYYRSKETISRQFHNVLHAMMKISQEYVKYQPCVIGNSEREKWRWFENCLGALDGTLIPVTITAEERPRYRDRKGDISTNMLGVCGPDLRFFYVLPGWEGSASDARVLRDALHRSNRFHVPNDKYYLVDAGYTNGPGFLAPYRGTRYHLKEWVGNRRPENYKELYNLRHSRARNVIERAFGLLKKRWSILRTPSFFDIKTQVRIINACCVLHNFIRTEQATDPVLEAQDLQFLASVDSELLNRSTREENENNSDGITSVQATVEWTAFRDTLALQMFHDYQAQTAANNS